MLAHKQRSARQNPSGAEAHARSSSGASREAVASRKSTAGRNSASHEETGNAHAIDRAARSSGQSLDAATRNSMESHLGHDLGGVRVHTGIEAASAAQALNARAFTVAKDIYFGANAFSPGTFDRNRLLMHELVHTVQQVSGSSTAPMTKLDVSQPGDPAEIEADRIADRLSSGASAGAVSPMPIMAARKAISRAPLKTNGGEFEVKNYTESDADKDNDTDKDVGAKIDIFFTPAEDIRSQKISFIQIIKPLNDGKPAFFENEKSRGTPGGWTLDRLAGMKSPNYGEQNTGLAGGNTIFGKRTSRTDFTKAFMHDGYNVPRSKGKTCSADAKAFALNVTNGKYLGGITWGFDTNTSGKVTKKTEAVFSMGNPPPEQAKALAKWNEQADFSGPDASKKNAPDQEKVAEP